VDLLKAQWAVREALAGATPPTPHLEPAGAMAAGLGGTELTPRAPVLEPAAVLFDAGLLRSLFSAICASAAQRGRRTEDTQRLVAAVEDNPALLEDLARKAAFGPAMEGLESLARETRVFIDALLFVGRALAGPFVAEAVQRIPPCWGGATGETDEGGRCSMCGSPPAIAQLRRGDGRRILYCGLCGTRWRGGRNSNALPGSSCRKGRRYSQTALCLVWLSHNEIPRGGLAAWATITPVGDCGG
jgi:hypothetical protein